MKDVQALPDARGISLEHVGVTRVPLPIKVKQKVGGFQQVRALTNLFVEVPKEIKGTHLSRLVEELTEWADEPVDSMDIQRLLERAATRCGANSAEVDVTFHYFLTKMAPVSGQVGYMDYECQFRGRLDDSGFHFILGVRVPITTLCPCSKEISDRGAHNQRSLVSAEVSYPAENQFIWIEDLIAAVESQGSCEVFPILKRTDEKFVTEAAFDNPKFVEDVVRDVIGEVRDAYPCLSWLAVECESQESIHGHNAFAGTKLGYQHSPHPEAATKASTLEPHRRLSRSLR